MRFCCPHGARFSSVAARRPWEYSRDVISAYFRSSARVAFLFLVTAKVACYSAFLIVISIYFSNEADEKTYTFFVNSDSGSERIQFLLQTL